MALGLFPGDAEMIAQQRRPATKSTMASVLDAQLTALESQFVPAAEAMPADKYSFAPTMGGYNGVRTFALEVKHVATANFIFYSAILGQALPTGVNLAGATNGPDDIQTKDQILRFLKDSLGDSKRIRNVSHAAECHDSAHQIACTPHEYQTGAGNLGLRARVGPLWTNGRVFAVEWNYSACKQGPAASECVRRMKP